MWILAAPYRFSVAENCLKVALLKVTNADSTVALGLLDNILIPFFADLSDSSWWVDHPLLHLASCRTERTIEISLNKEHPACMRCSEPIG